MSESAPGYFDSSRRLTGPNLYFRGCAAIADVLAATDAQVAQWESRLRRMVKALEWPEPQISIDRHAGGASLAFTAPLDQLLSATEVNEWAWQGAAVATQGSPLPQAPGHPATWDFDSALETIRRFAASESNRKAMMLLAIAAQHGLPAFYDDDSVSVGAGQGSRTWPLGELPANLADVDWTTLHDIPTVLVTGSNGKTTTVRLLAEMFRASGKRAGFNCTDGVFIDGEQVGCGDYSGPSGARLVLRDTRVDAAVLETARGGILRRGLAVDHANVGIVTNISPDHFGEYGVHDLARLADAKLVLARAMGADSVLVLNADDPLLLEKSANLACPMAWFAMDYMNPRLEATRAAGGMSCGVADGELLLHVDGLVNRLGAIAQMPLTIAGSARYNIANIAGAALVAAALGIAPDVIKRVLSEFGRSRLDNPGRLERWRIGGVDVLLDYAHNPDGLRGLLAVAEAMRTRSGGRLGLLLGQAGNRDDAAIRELACTAAAARPEWVVLKDMVGYMRGRESGAVPAVLRDQLLRQGMPEASVHTILVEVDGALALLEWARPGDVLVLPVHNLDARAELVALLDARSSLAF